MFRQRKILSFLLLSSQIAVFLCSFIIYHEITILHYINVSFYIASIFLFLSLFIFTLNSGFFDFATKSFRLIFSGKNVTREEIEEMRPLSEIFTFNYSPVFVIGVFNLGLMLIALFIYYN